MKKKNNPIVSGLILMGTALVTVTVLIACDPDGGFANPFFDFSPPPHEHVWGEWSQISEATCIAKGAATRVCAEDASHVETKALPIIPGAHRWEMKEDEDNIPPTCIEPGWGIQVCLNCQKIELDSEIAPLGHEFEGYELASAPTCSAPGVETARCARISIGCDAVGERYLDIDPDAHEWGEDYTVIAAATCMAEGLMEGICVYNSAHASSSIAIPLDPDAHGWDNEFYALVPASCVAPGREEKTCSWNSAHAETNETEPLDPAAHSWPRGYRLIDAVTCMKAGLEERTCALSAAHVEERLIALDPNAHAYDTYLPLTPATCMAEGSERGTCAWNRSHTPHTRSTGLDLVNGHSWGAWTAGGSLGKTGTCAEFGVEMRTCALSAEHVGTQETPLNPDAHDWNIRYTLTTAATCTTPGVLTDTCKNDERHTRTQNTAIDLNAHVWNNAYASTLAATCMATGQSKDTCSLQPAHTRDRTDAVNPDAHSWPASYTPTFAATCTAQGSQIRLCNLNNEHIDTQAVAALGHSWGAYAVTLAATCVAAGSESRTCARETTHKETQSVAALGHSYGNYTVRLAATCITYGEESGTCARDSAHVDTREIAINRSAHVWQNEFRGVISYATCTTAGQEYRTCIYVGLTDSDYPGGARAHANAMDTRAIPINPDNHSYVIDIFGNSAGAADFTVTTPATCIATGLATAACAYNPAHPSDTQDIPIDPSAHSLSSSYAVIRNATCAGSGLERMLCGRDSTHYANGVEYLTPNDPNNHDSRYITNATTTLAATCIATGVRSATCSGGGGYPHATVTVRNAIIPIDPDAHLWYVGSGQDENGWWVSEEATCSKQGEERRVCDRNNETVWTHVQTRKTPIVPDAHSYISDEDIEAYLQRHEDAGMAGAGEYWVRIGMRVTVEGNCTEKGYKLYKCGHAEDPQYIWNIQPENAPHVKKVETPIDPGAHDYQWSYTGVTETRDGTRQRRCTRNQAHTYGESEPAYATGTPGLVFKHIYYPNGEHDVNVIGYTGTASTVNIPVNVLDPEIPSDYYNEWGIVDTIENLRNSAFTSINFSSYSIVAIVMGFTGNKNLARIDLPNNVQFIGPDAFSGCTSLASVSGGNGLAAIPSRAFKGCTSLTEITNSTFRNIEQIGPEAFSGCAKLREFAFLGPGKLAKIREGAFQGCTSLASIIIPGTVTELSSGSDSNSGVFSGCTSLASVYFGGGSQLATIGDNTFNGCAKLTGITIPNSVTAIGDSAFSGCAKLTGITIPNSVTAIGDSAFLNCASLAGTITIPNSVTTIGSGAFWNCTGLTSITIPASVTTIGSAAFRGCANLATITFLGTTYIGSNAIHGKYDDWYTAWMSNITIYGPKTYRTTAPVSDDSIWSY